VKWWGANDEKSIKRFYVVWFVRIADNCISVCISLIGDSKMKEISGLKNLASKMIKIMKEVPAIEKSGRNTFHKYSYATEADISAAFSTAMKNNNVFMFSSITDRECTVFKTAKGADSFLVTVKLEITFIDADSGETFVSTFYGDGTDSGDKGIYKAITGAQKYALMKTFLLQTGDDPENDNQVVNRVNKNHEINNIDKEKVGEALKKAALMGTDALKDAWNKMPSSEKLAIKPKMDEFKRLAEQSVELISEVAQ